MAFDNFLEEQISKILSEKNILLRPMNMMSGLCYMVDEKMCLEIVKDTLMARVGLNAYESVIKKDGYSEMNFTGRKMKDYVFIAPEAFDRDSDLKYWVNLCLAFNPFAKASKKKKKRIS